MTQDRYLLHPEVIKGLPVSGRKAASYLQRRAQQIEASTAGIKDPNISVVLRTRNNSQYIDSLLNDIEAQIFNGQVEVILVDTESTDGTTKLAKKHNARIINIKQRDFNYPRALNLGYEAAKYPYVATVSGHSNLSNRYAFKSLTYWTRQPNFGGLYCTPYINWNASRTERWGSAIRPAKQFKLAEVVNKPHMGFMTANGSIVSKDVWSNLGGYDERYANGGEDTDLGRKMLAAGYMVVREPLMTALHSHGLGPINNIKQFVHWYDIYRHAKPFEHDDILKRRPDLQ